MTNTAAASARGPEACKCNLGILFVHGIGAQQRGASLSAFGRPICTWLRERFDGHDQKWRDALSDQPKFIEWWQRIENWATDDFVGPRPPSPSGTDPFEITRKIGKEKKWDTLVGRAALVDSRVADPGDADAPAHAVLQISRLTVDGELCHERWLLAESWWAETFSTPSFTEFARWGIRIIPWTIGSHFGARLRHAFAQWPSGNGRAAARWRRVVRSCGRLLRVVGAVLALVAGVLVSPLVLAAFGLLLLLAVLPIPQLREWVLRIQLQVAATLGDSYVLLDRPIEAAAIIAQVRRDVDWLAGQCCGVAVVAHSQGGAVAHLALQRGVPNHLRLLFTFGSGLKKLEQLRYLLESGESLRRSSIFTIIALPSFAIGLAWFVLLPFASSEAHTQLWRSIPLMLGWTVVFGVVAVAGLRDYVKPNVPDRLRRWLARLRELPFAWVDSYATADPVSNGVLMEEDIARQCSEEVCNMSSMLNDHTSYWANRDEFVTLLITKLADAHLRRGLGLPPATELASDRAELEYLAKRRRWRVGLWTAIGWIGAAAVLVSVARAWPAWSEFFSYWGRRFVGWAARIAGIDIPPPRPVRVHWGAVGYLALAMVPLWIARTIWRRQNEAEMRQIVERYARLEMPIGVLMAIFFQVMFAVGVAEGGMPGFLEVLGTMLGVWVPILLLAPRPLLEEKTPNRAVASDLDGSAERITMHLLTKVMMLGPAFGFGIAAWWVVCWVARALLGGTIFGFDPKRVSAGWIGLGFAAAWGCIIAFRWWRGRAGRLGL